MIELDRKSKVLLSIFTLAVLAAVFATYNRAVVRQDFEIVESEEAFEEEDAPVEEGEAVEEELPNEAEVVPL